MSYQKTKPFTSSLILMLSIVAIEAQAMNLKLFLAPLFFHQAASSVQNTPLLESDHRALGAGTDVEGNFGSQATYFNPPSNYTDAKGITFVTGSTSILWIGIEASMNKNEEVDVELPYQITSMEPGTVIPYVPKKEFEPLTQDALYGVWSRLVNTDPNTPYKLSRASIKGAASEANDILYSDQAPPTVVTIYSSSTGRDHGPAYINTESVLLVGIQFVGPNGPVEQRALIDFRDYESFVESLRQEISEIISLIMKEDIGLSGDDLWSAISTLRLAYITRVKADSDVFVAQTRRNLRGASFESNNDKLARLQNELAVLQNELRDLKSTRRVLYSDGYSNYQSRANAQRIRELDGDINRLEREIELLKESPSAFFVNILETTMHSAITTNFQENATSYDTSDLTLQTQCLYPDQEHIVGPAFHPLDYQVAADATTFDTGLAFSAGSTRRILDYTVGSVLTESFDSTAEKEKATSYTFEGNLAVVMTGKNEAGEQHTVFAVTDWLKAGKRVMVPGQDRAFESMSDLQYFVPDHYDKICEITGYALTDVFNKALPVLKEKLGNVSSVTHSYTRMAAYTTLKSEKDDDDKSSCFKHDDSTYKVEENGSLIEVPLSKVKIGDEILSGPHGMTNRVISINHKDAQSFAKFYKFNTADEKSHSVTTGHYVPSLDCDKGIDQDSSKSIIVAEDLARQVSLSDSNFCLRLVNPATGESYLSRIVSVEENLEQGVIHLTTTSGMIVVNNVTATSVALLPNVSPAQFAKFMDWQNYLLGEPENEDGSVEPSEIKKKILSLYKQFVKNYN